MPGPPGAPGAPGAPGPPGASGNPGAAGTGASLLSTGQIDGGITSTFYFKKGSGYSFSALSFYQHSPKMDELFGDSRTVEWSSRYQLEDGADFSIFVYRLAQGMGGWALVGSGSMQTGARSATLNFTALLNNDYAVGFSYDGIQMLEASANLF